MHRKKGAHPILVRSNREPNSSLHHHLAEQSITPWPPATRARELQVGSLPRPSSPRAPPAGAASVVRPTPKATWRTRRRRRRPAWRRPPSSTRCRRAANPASRGGRWLGRSGARARRRRWLGRSGARARMRRRLGRRAYSGQNRRRTASAAAHAGCCVPPAAARRRHPAAARRSAHPPVVPLQPSKEEVRLFCVSRRSGRIFAFRLRADPKWVLPLGPLLETVSGRQI